VLHLKWDAPAFSPRGNSLVLPAFQSIELLRDYRRAEQAIAKRWATPFRLLKEGGAFGQKMVMPDQKMLEAAGPQPTCARRTTAITVAGMLQYEQYPQPRHKFACAARTFATASVSLQKMLVMIREIKQAARDILAWVFDDWLELKGYKDKTLQFLFSDLDPSDAVDFKRLLIELYDRKLISRSSLQLKMDLDPDIEAANRENERKSVDLLDEKQVKPIVDMVMAGIMSVETAQEMLGLDREKNRAGAGRAEGSWGGPFARADTADEVCDACIHFDEARNFCRVHRAETTFDSSVCRFFDPRTPAQAAPEEAGGGDVPAASPAPGSAASAPCRECGS